MTLEERLLLRSRLGIEPRPFGGCVIDPTDSAYTDGYDARIDAWLEDAEHATIHQTRLDARLLECGAPPGQSGAPLPRQRRQIGPLCE